MKSNCMVKNIAYMAKTEIGDNEEKFYIGITEYKWKKDIIIISWILNTENVKMLQYSEPIIRKFREVGRCKIIWKILKE